MKKGTKIFCESLEIVRNAKANNFKARIAKVPGEKEEYVLIIDDEFNERRLHK